MDIVGVTRSGRRGVAEGLTWLCPFGPKLENRPVLTGARYSGADGCRGSGQRSGAPWAQWHGSRTASSPAGRLPGWGCRQGGFGRRSPQAELRPSSPGSGRRPLTYRVCASCPQRASAWCHVPLPGTPCCRCSGREAWLSPRLPQASPPRTSHTPRVGGMSVPNGCIFFHLYFS